MTASLQRLLPCLLALFGLAVSVVCAQSVRPGFVDEPLHSPNRAPVDSIVSAPAADFVILDGGLEQGLRLGMVCVVTRGNRELGELIIIESRIDRAAALILELDASISLQAGDIARIKTLQSS